MRKPAPLIAATIYWAAILALGFALGTVRVGWLAPRIGASAAVLVELPVMLAASAWLARRLTRRYRIAAAHDALAMGALAFALLLASEAALAVLAFGQAPRAWLASLATAPGALGLGGQLLFGAMPLLVRMRRRG